MRIIHWSCWSCKKDPSRWASYTRSVPASGKKKPSPVRQTLHKPQWYVVSRHSGVVFMFNAVVMLYNAHTICVILGVNMQCSPKGGPRRGGKGKWGSSNSHSHHLFENIESTAANGVLRVYTHDAAYDSHWMLWAQKWHLLPNFVTRYSPSHHDCHPATLYVVTLNHPHPRHHQMNSFIKFSKLPRPHILGRKDWKQREAMSKLQMISPQVFKHMSTLEPTQHSCYHFSLFYVL